MESLYSGNRCKLWMYLNIEESRKKLCLVFFVCFLDYSLRVVGLLVWPISQQPNPNSTQYLNKIKLSSLTPNQAQLLKFKPKKLHNSMLNPYNKTLRQSITHDSMYIDSET